jgi:S-adenosylmethionine:tRNA ribosyltransferase-isomerase
MASLSDIEYELPKNLIATRPADRRGFSRLLALDRKAKTVADRMFPDMLEYLREGDLLVLNDTRVFSARLLGEADSGRALELLLVESLDGRIWKAMVRSSRKFRDGDRFRIGGESGAIGSRVEDGLRLVAFDRTLSFEDIDLIGRTPLPPYIVSSREEKGTSAYVPEDAEWYQSVFARNSGSVAAPTASLHFTPELLADLERKGVRKVFVTLHVGPGTFKPVEDSVDNFEIHSERVTVGAETVDAIRSAKAEGRRVVAVGTTVVRSIETMAQSSENPDHWVAFDGWTRLFIKDDFPFRATDALITNFHMSRSTLLLLVQSFGGRELVRSAYQHAVESSYRFLSYGDAMFLF